MCTTQAFTTNCLTTAQFMRCTVWAISSLSVLHPKPQSWLLHSCSPHAARVLLKSTAECPTQAFMASCPTAARSNVLHSIHK